MICENVLEYIGHTPIVRLNRMNDPDAAEVLVKYEGLNVGGSIKTRTAYNMIKQALKDGYIKDDTIIVEPTSGNQGIGLALIGAVMGYQTKIIMPDSVSAERRLLVKHYGAEVILVHDAGDIGACMDECLKTAMKMAEEDPRVYIPQQFENPANPKVHKHHTGLEILEQVAGPIHGFCSGIGTGGTISGIGETLKAQYPDIEIWAVEPENAAILSCLNRFFVGYYIDIIINVLIKILWDYSIANTHLKMCSDISACKDRSIFGLYRPDLDIGILCLESLS